MTEFEKIAYAKVFIDKLANGINPIDVRLLPKTISQITYEYPDAFSTCPGCCRRA